MGSNPTPRTILFFCVWAVVRFWFSVLFFVCVGFVGGVFRHRRCLFWLSGSWGLFWCCLGAEWPMDGLRGCLCGLWLVAGGEGGFPCVGVVFLVCISAPFGMDRS